MAEECSSKFHQIPEALWERIDLVIPIYKRSLKGPSETPHAKGCRRYFVCLVDRLSVEGDAQGVRLWQRDPYVLSRVGEVGCVPKALGTRPERIR
jgi:hypothetical protein